MMRFSTIRPTPAERDAVRPGDDIVSPADVVMDRAFTVVAAPEQVWPWLAQLGKRRAGWYLPSRVEAFVPRSRRALRRIDARWQVLDVDDVIPDYGGRNETFVVALIDPPHHLVYRSQRGRTVVTWSISLDPIRERGRVVTRVSLRLRMAPVKRKWLAESAGELIDVLTIAGLAAGLNERLRNTSV